MRLIFLYIYIEAFKIQIKDYYCVIYRQFIKFKVTLIKLYLYGVDANLNIIFYSLLIKIIFLSSLGKIILSSFKQLDQPVKYRDNFLYSTISPSFALTFKRTYSLFKWLKDFNIFIYNRLIIYIQASNPYLKGKLNFFILSALPNCSYFN